MFNYHSSRAKKARFARHLENAVIRALLLAIAALLLIGWFYCVFVLGFAVAHLLLGPVGLLLTPYLWYRGELAHLAPIPNGSTVDQILERETLAKLPENPTPTQIMEVVMNTRGGRFFGARFALSAPFIKEMLSGDTTEAEVIWQDALTLSRQAGEPELTSASIFVALVKRINNHEYYLAQLNIDEDDVVAGLAWHTHIRNVIKNQQQKQFHGGIGRDFSFGWAPLLNRIGINISERIQSGGLLHREIEGHEEVIAQVSHLLGQPGRRNAVLVGDVGVGKTTLVHALAQRLLENPKAAGNLAYRQVIELDSASLIAQARGRGELENLLIRLLNEAAHAKNVILFLDEAQLFLEEGTGSVDLSNILLPVLEGGGIRMILAMTDQQWLSLAQTNPGLAQLMNRVVVSPLEETSTMRVVEDQVLLLEAQHGITYMYQSLREAYKLARRYVREQSFPGKAIRLLEAAAAFPEEKYFITAESVQKAVEKNFDVKVQTASTKDEKDTLLNLEGKIHERMINQTRAVKVVSDALRRARAGVRNESKPIGTFLFLGPTGVGKTELSKALASVYFGGEDRIVRLDLNEYSQPQDVSRVLAAPAEYAESLCAQISKQPFSVVLLDEIEKAHPNVLNVLLQMLDEGILRDAENKEVSFRDAIIIATSNAGADRIRQHIEKGEQLEHFEEAFVNELVDQNLFRPEFLNRFDEIVLFRPLTVDELTQVVDLIVASINKTLAAQKVGVKLTDSAKRYLAETGYDPRLGARPLRRVAQRSIENVVAQRLLSESASPGQTIELDVPELSAALDTRSASTK